MRRRGWTSRWPRRLLASGVGGMVLLAGTLAAHAQARPGPVTGWVRQFAAPLTTVDPAAPLGDRRRGDRRPGRVDPRGGGGGDRQAPHPAPAGRADGLPLRRLGGGLVDRAPDRQVHPDRQG